MIFDYTPTNQPIGYHFLYEEDNIFMKGRAQNSIEALLEIEHKKNRAGEPFFSIRIRNYKQSNAKGFYRWAGNLHTLREKIDFQLNEDYQLGKVINMATVQNKFLEIKPQLLVANASEKEAAGMISGVEKMLQDPEQFSHSLRFTHPYLLFFSGIYGKKMSENNLAKGYRELPNFIPIKKVPILTEEKLGKQEGNFQEVEVKGKLDKENFEQDKLTSFIRLLKNRPRVPTLLELNYTERYRIDQQNNWPEQAMCMSLAKVPGTLYQSQKTMIKRTNI